MLIGCLEVQKIDVVLTDSCQIFYRDRFFHYEFKQIIMTSFKGYRKGSALNRPCINGLIKRKLTAVG